jgi:hypothetical protein
MRKSAIDEHCAGHRRCGPLRLAFFCVAMH